jgi:hypothetical protein
MTSPTQSETRLPDNHTISQTIMQSSAYARTLLILEEGGFGLGPDTASPGDRICVILGCDTPLALRPLSDGTFVVVGDSYVNNLMDGEALLGPLPSNRQCVARDGPDGVRYPAYVDRQTGGLCLEDPRLAEPLPKGWEVATHDKEEFLMAFLHLETGERTWQDPRLTEDALSSRGVPLRWFELV